MHAHVWIGPHKIERHLWHRVRPNAGVELAIRVVPQQGGEGGKDPLRIFLMVAVIALSIVAPYLAPVTWGVGAGTLGGTLISAGIAIAGQLSSSALVRSEERRVGKAWVRACR